MDSCIDCIMTMLFRSSKTMLGCKFCFFGWNFQKEGNKIGFRGKKFCGIIP